jgi:hypothetical protein
LRIFGAAQHNCEAVQRESNDVFFRRRGPIKPFATNQITTAAASDRRDYIVGSFFSWWMIGLVFPPFVLHDKRKSYAFLYSSK